MKASPLSLTAGPVEHDGCARPCPKSTQTNRAQCYRTLAGSGALCSPYRGQENGTFPQGCSVLPVREYLRVRETAISILRRVWAGRQPKMQAKRHRHKHKASFTSSIQQLGVVLLCFDLCVLLVGAFALGRTLFLYAHALFSHYPPQTQTQTSNFWSSCAKVLSATHPFSYALNNCVKCMCMQGQEW